MFVCFLSFSLDLSVFCPGFFSLIIVIEVEKSRRKPTTSDNKKKNERMKNVCMSIQIIVDLNKATRYSIRQQKKKEKNCIHTLILLKSLYV